MKITTIGLDLAKNVFQVHGIDADEKVVVISTGNHFWFDAFTGALTAGAALLIATTVLARVRPNVWSFAARPAGGTPPAEATA